MDLEMKWLLLIQKKPFICLQKAYNFIEFIIRAKGHFLLVNTNLKYNRIIQQMAKKNTQNYVNHKWIGGFLTN